MNMALIQNGEMEIGYDDAGQDHWKLLEDRKFTVTKEKPDDGKWTSVKMPADEELNTAKLDELKQALDNLQIVDVARKARRTERRFEGRRRHYVQRRSGEVADA